MRIVIVGLGQTGQELAKELLEAEHEIFVIDTNVNEVEEFTNHYDAIGVVGSGASKKVQIQAKVATSDVLIALTPSDEVNLMSCITAKLLGAKYTIARVSSEEYKEDERYLIKNLKIDAIIDAEYDTSKEITRIVTYPSSIRTGAFANGKVDMAEIKVKEGSTLENLKLTEVKTKFHTELIVASIVRNGKLIIPRGDATILKDDEVCVIAQGSEIYRFLTQLNLIEKPVKSILLVGCGSIGKYLLKDLVKMKLKVKVIEFEQSRCMELMREFPEVTIVHGNGVDSKILLEEGIKDHDCCISLTGADETNLVVTLFAWSCQVRKLITKVISLSYTKMLHNVEIDNTLSPHLMVLSAVQRFIRGVSDKNQSIERIKSLHRFSKNMAEAIEFDVEDNFAYLGQTLRQLKIRKNVVVAFLLRNNEIIIPNGETKIERNDRVIVVANATQNIAKLEEIIEIS